MTEGRCKYNQKPLIQLAPAFFYLLKETVHYKRVAKCSHVKLLYTAHLPKTHSKTQIRKNNLLSKRTKGQQVRIVCCCCLSFPVFVIVPAPNLDTCTNTQMLTDAKKKKKQVGGEAKKKQLTHLIPNSLPAMEAALKSLNLYCENVLSFQFGSRWEWRPEDVPEPGSCPTPPPSLPACLLLLTPTLFPYSTQSPVKESSSSCTEPNNTHGRAHTTPRLLSHWHWHGLLQSSPRVDGGVRLNAVGCHHAFTDDPGNLVDNTSWQGQ